MRFFIISFFLIVFVGCTKSNTTSKRKALNISEIAFAENVIDKSVVSEIGELEKSLIDAGLSDVQNIEPNIEVDLKYSSVDNFMGFDMYGDLNTCYLQPDVAEGLAKAYEYLQSKDSTLTLLVYDGVRPRSVQQKMWDALDMPFNEKIKFVSNPKSGSLHNFGAAVDITIANKESKEALDMGAPYDHIGIEAYPIKERQMLAAGRISQQAVDNRKLLRRSMKEGGFFNIQTEWWHFNACYRKNAIEKYEIIEGVQTVLLANNR